jgi:putative membrane protein
MILPGNAHLGHIVRYVRAQLVWLFVWDVLVTVYYWEFAPHWMEIPPLPLTLLGSAVVVYLTFRNNTAYARWWEARTLWGAMINASRSFARELRLMLVGKEALRAELVHRQIAYAQALRLHLRRQPPWEELQPRLGAAAVDRLRRVANVPNAILGGSADLIANGSSLDSVRLASIARIMVDITNAQGGMERIKNTPLPQQLATYPALLTHFLCLLLPLGMVDSMGWCTPAGSTVASFLFLTLLQIGNDLQNPFENTENDVPMTAITRTIEIDLRDDLGETHELAPVQPENGALW